MEFENDHFPDYFALFFIIFASKSWENMQET